MIARQTNSSIQILSPCALDFRRAACARNFRRAAGFSITKENVNCKEYILMQVYSFISDLFQIQIWKVAHARTKWTRSMRAQFLTRSLRAQFSTRSDARAIFDAQQNFSITKENVNYKET